MNTNLLTALTKRLVNGHTVQTKDGNMADRYVVKWDSVGQYWYIYDNSMQLRLAGKYSKKRNAQINASVRNGK